MADSHMYLKRMQQGFASANQLGWQMFANQMFSNLEKSNRPLYEMLEALLGPPRFTDMNRHIARESVALTLYMFWPIQMVSEKLVRDVVDVLADENRDSKAYVDQRNMILGKGVIVMENPPFCEAYEYFKGFLRQVATYEKPLYRGTKMLCWVIAALTQPEPILDEKSIAAQLKKIKGIQL